MTCKHGPTECIGDVLILCAANLPFPSEPSGRTPTVRYLGFANCLLSSYERIPEREFIEHCALEHGLDFDSLNRCASSEDDDKNGGLALLRESARRNDALAVEKSCTVRVNERVWCVRDDGVWKECEGNASKAVLVEEINRLWREKNHLT